MKVVACKRRPGSGTSSTRRGARKTKLETREAKKSAWMNGNETASISLPLDAHRDARLLVRLVQCSTCSRPFRAPVTLPCGHAVCRTCLPTAHVRIDISYPARPDRQRGIQCPIESCGEDHPLGECNVDVTLSKVMEGIEAVVTTATSEIGPDTALMLEELVNEEEEVSEETEDEKHNEKQQEPSRTYSRNGGCLLATYTLAAEGHLAYTSEVVYHTSPHTGTNFEQLDHAFLVSLRESLADKLECSVCYNTMHEPVTASCGHTFCRSCLTRTLDHTQHCPWCRQSLPMPPSLERHPNNIRLTKLLMALCPETVASRAEAVAREARDLGIGGEGDLSLALFVCALGFPSMPTFLHIFEPRYRLMIRRAMQGNGRFGMLMYNHAHEAQGHLGITNFMRYGTMLQIVNVQMLPDGRSLIETRGVHRFKVLEHGLLDGYQVGRVERVEDVSWAEEERLEALELSLANNRPDSPMEITPVSPQQINSSVEDNPNPASYIANSTSDTVEPTTTATHHRRPSATTPLEALSTRQLHEIGLEFINCMQQNSAPWLHQRIIDGYGGPPDDPANFPYWFATVLPIAETEKYQLLKTTSVRERLKIVVGWIRTAERGRW